MHAGSYEVCITVEGEPDFIICYNVVIIEPEELGVTRSVDYVNETVSFELSGGLNYTIDFNGLFYSTSENEITLSLNPGINTIKIRTELECQGIYDRSIYLSNDLLIYPNPVEDQLNILFGNINSEKVSVTIYSNLGQTVFLEHVNEHDGLIAIDTSLLSPGIYFVTVESKAVLTTFKIVKK